MSALSDFAYLQAHPTDEIIFISVAKGEKGGYSVYRHAIENAFPWKDRVFIQVFDNQETTFSTREKALEKASEAAQRLSIPLIRESCFFLSQTNQWYQPVKIEPLFRRNKIFLMDEQTSYEKALMEVEKLSKELGIPFIPYNKPAEVRFGFLNAIRSKEKEENERIKARFLMSYMA